jgi:hypothetical protein
MQLLNWFKRIFSSAPSKPAPHKVVRTKAKAAQQKLSRMAAKDTGRPKIKPAAKFGSKRGR